MGNLDYEKEKKILGLEKIFVARPFGLIGS